jgi:hypothetical protein
MNWKLFLSPIFAFALLGLAPRPAAAVVPAVSQDDDAGYAVGTKAMNDQRWSDAVLSFDQVIKAKGKKVDAALYWKAYSLNKLGKQQLASDTCVQLGTQFKSSTWNEDCRVLSLSLGGAQNPANAASSPDGPAAKGRRQTDPDAEIKILALNSLLHQNPAQAMPQLRGILAGDQPMSFKQHALFVVAQSRSPEADALMHDLILGKMGSDLQQRAIHDCGIYKGQRGNDELAEVYRTTTDIKVKHAVISAFFVSEDDTRLVELARQEKDLGLKRTIVSQLSLMRGKAATDYMMELLK